MVKSRSPPPPKKNLSPISKIYIIFPATIHIFHIYPYLTPLPPSTSPTLQPYISSQTYHPHPICISNSQLHPNHGRQRVSNHPLEYPSLVWNHKLTPISNIPLKLLETKNNQVLIYDCLLCDIIVIINLKNKKNPRPKICLLEQRVFLLDKSDHSIDTWNFKYLNIQ